ncbi:MAG: hypothetical protein ACNA7X_04740 [Dehalococcoidia bacterium]
MYLAEPGPVAGILSQSMLVLVLGVFIVIVGIVIAGIVYRESREWKKIVLPIFDSPPPETEAGSAEESDEAVRQKAAINKEIFSRIFGHMDVAGLLGGGATVILGLLIVLIALTLNG